MSITTAESSSAATLATSEPCTRLPTGISTELKLVDAGYLSWIYGTMPYYGGWDTIRHSFRGSLFLMDSGQSWRKEVDPEYKGRRVRRRELDPETLARKAKVDAFRQLLMEDYTIDICWLTRFEADDLIAIHWLHNPDAVAVAVDKDLLQVPGMWKKMEAHNGQRRTDLHSGLKRAPGFWPGCRDERDVLLGQLLFGDRTDTIPRLLPARDFSAASYLYHHPHPLTAAYDLWGPAVINNLKMLVIPAMPLSRLGDTYERHPRLWLEHLESGYYWDPHHFRHTCPDRVESEGVVVVP